MVVGIISLKQFADWNHVSSISQFVKGMIDDCFSFGRDVVSHILNKIQVKNVVTLAEDFFDYPNLLGSQENSKGIQIKIKCVRWHGSWIFRIEFLNVCVARVEIFNISTKKLELEFIIDLGELIEPVHSFISKNFIFITWSYINGILFVSS